MTTLSTCWEEVLENWGFVSNLTAELLGAVITVFIGYLVVKAWNKRQRRLPTALALQRLEGSMRHILGQASGYLGFGFPPEFSDWTAAKAMEVLLPFIGDSKEAKLKRSEVESRHWVDLSSDIVSEYDRLEAYSRNYTFIFPEDPTLFSKYSMLDSEVEKLRVSLHVIEKRDEQAPGLVTAVEDLLPSYVTTCLIPVSTLYIHVAQSYADLRRSEPGVVKSLSEASALRSLSAYAEHMEKLMREMGLGDNAEAQEESHSG